MKPTRRKSLFRRKTTTVAKPTDCCNPLKVCELNKILGVFCFWTMFVFVFVVLSLIAGFLVYRLGASMPIAPQQTETTAPAIENYKLPVDPPTITTVPPVGVQGNNFFDFGGVVIVEQPPTVPTNFVNINNIQNNFVNVFRIPCCEPSLQINQWFQMWTNQFAVPPVIDRFEPNNEFHQENYYRMNCIPEPSAVSLATMGMFLIGRRRTR